MERILNHEFENGMCWDFRTSELKEKPVAVFHRKGKEPVEIYALPDGRFVEVDTRINLAVICECDLQTILETWEEEEEE